MMKTILYGLVLSLLFFACNTSKKIAQSAEQKTSADQEILYSPASKKGIIYASPSGDGVINSNIIISGIIKDSTSQEGIGGVYLTFKTMDYKDEIMIQTDTSGFYQVELSAACYTLYIINGFSHETITDTICINKEKGDYYKQPFNYYMKSLKSVIGEIKTGSGTGSTGMKTGTNTNVGLGKAIVKRPTVVIEIELPKKKKHGKSEEIEDINMVAQNNLNRIATGTFRYDPIPPLPIDTVYLFQLEIIPGQDSAKFTAVTGNKTGKAIQKKIRIASEMSIHIISPNKAFEIQQVSDSVQVIDPISSTVWRWSVIPRKLGKHPVIVSIDILTKGEETGETRKKSIEVFNEEVEVFVIENASTITAAHAAEKTFNWLYAAIPLVLVLIGGVVFFFRKKQKEDEEKEWLIAPNAAVLLSEVENKIADGDTETAIQKLMDFFKESEQLRSELLNISAQYQTYKREEMQGLEPPKKILNRINLAIIEMVNGLQSKLRHA